MADKSIAGSIVDLAKLGLLAGAGFLIYKNWGGIKSTAGSIGGKLTSAVNSATDTVGKGVSDLGDLLTNKDVKQSASSTEDPEEKNAGLKQAASNVQAMQVQSMNTTPTTTAPTTTTVTEPVTETPSENLPTTNLTGNSIYDALPDISKSAYDIVSGVGRASGTTPLLQSTNVLQIAGGLIGNGIGSLWDLLSGKK